MRENRPGLQELVRESSLIFSGTVVALSVSTVANLAPRDNFAAVRIDRPLRSDPALGDLRDRLITVELLTPTELQPKAKATFFALDWILGGGIAVHEVAHLDVQQEDSVAAEVARLPERHLADLLADAALVVIAEVTGRKSTPFDITWRDAPQWAAATLRIVDVLRGESTQSATVLFPTSGRPTWASAPRLTKGERAIFLLHRAGDGPPLPDGYDPSQAFIILDPADVQPESQRPQIERLLGEGRSR
jgi:hypothetical protein